jgi:hypothetical protein
MLHALLHRKLDEFKLRPERFEDALTSTVFGAIFWAEDRELLEKWLGIPPSSSQRIPVIEYWFWPRLGPVEPDVVFRLGNVLVVVEAKYRSDRHDKAPKPEEEESVGDQLVRQYESIALPVSQRKQYAEAIECAICECQLIQLYVVDGGRQRARREFEESKQRIEESKKRLHRTTTLNLVTWQSLSRAMNVNNAENQGWRSDLAGYLRHCGLDIFGGFSRWQAPEGELFQIREWSMRIAYPKLRFQSAFKPESVQPAMLLRWNLPGGVAEFNLRRAFSHELLEGTAQRVILSWRSQAYSSMRATHPGLQFQSAFKAESVRPAMLLRWNLPSGVAEFNLRRAFGHELLEGTAQRVILSWRSQA